MVSQRYIQLVESLKELHIKKNAGYSGKDNPDPWSNFREAEKFGVSPVQGCLIRMSDKYSRIITLLKNTENEQVGESIKETLQDLAAYAMIAICLIEEYDRDTGENK